MHFLAYVVSSVCQPISLIAVLLLFALIVMPRHPSAARASVLLGFSLLALTGWRVLSDAALRPLEDYYAVPTGDLSKYVGVIVLGGVIRRDDGRGHGQFSTGEASERITEALTLLRRYPSFRLVFTGGDASMQEGGVPEADAARIFFTAVGIGADRAMYERQSLNTYENAVMTAALLGGDARLPWLLVTSASHMRRATKTFQAAGLNVTPYPVDFLSDADTRWSDYSFNGGAEAWRVWAKEHVGYWVYKAVGRF